MLEDSKTKILIREICSLDWMTATWIVQETLTAVITYGQILNLRGCWWTWTRAWIKSIKFRIRLTLWRPRVKVIRVFKVNLQIFSYNDGYNHEYKQFCTDPLPTCLLFLWLHFRYSIILDKFIHLNCAGVSGDRKVWVMTEQTIACTYMVLQCIVIVYPFVSTQF